MAKVNGLSDQAVAQLMELFRREQMRLIPPPIPTQRRRRIYAANEGVPFINESGETVPPYGVMQVSDIDEEGVVHIVKPDGNPRNSVPYLINRGVEVFDNYNGTGDWGLDGNGKALVKQSISGSYTAMGAKGLEANVDAWYLSTHSDTDREGFGFYNLGRFGASNPTVDGVACYVMNVTQVIEQPQLSYQTYFEELQDGTGSPTGDILDTTGTTSGWILWENYHSSPLGNAVDYAGLRGGWKEVDRANPVATHGSFVCTRKGYYKIEVTLPYYITMTDSLNDLFDTVNTSSDGTPAHTHTYQKINVLKLISNGGLNSALTVSGIDVQWYNETVPTTTDGYKKNAYMCHTKEFNVGDTIGVKVSIGKLNGIDFTARIINAPGDFAYPRIQITRLRNWRGIA